jgi:hypothetical protein
MDVIASCQSLSARAAILAILLLLGISGIAQGAKAPASKGPAAKSAPIDDNATWLLAGREGELRAAVAARKKEPGVQRH